MLLLAAALGCGRAASPPVAGPSPAPTARPLPSGALPPGTYVTTAVRRTFTRVVPTDARDVWIDEVTRPVDGNDARQLTWRTTRDATVRIGGQTLTFARGERNHAIVVSAPGAPVLVLMAARNADYRTGYDEGHRVVFGMRIGP